jgi:colanic acid biosynthesis protein WcaH
MTTSIPREEYLNIIKNTQINSVDMIIFNNEGEVLLGKRNNEPAKNTWFVPGGKIQKFETLEQATKRKSKEELGIELNYEKELGVYCHNYTNNFVNEDFGTNFIVFAVTMTIHKTINLDKDEQHNELRWWKIHDLLKSNEVHNYTKNYFHPNPHNKYCSKH